MQRERIAFAAAVLIQFAALCAIATLGDLRFHIHAFLVLIVVCSLAHVATVSLCRCSIPAAAIIAIAIGLRFPLAFTPPSLSDDVWRYIHDGRAQIAGVNPYTFAPSDTATLSFRGPEHARINNPDLPTIYPPTAQLAFALSAAIRPGLASWKLIVLLAELGIIILLLRSLKPHDQFKARFYAWHPLVILEFAGSAHMDAIAILPTIAFLAFHGAKPLRAAAALGLAVAAKFLPLIFVPALFVKREFRAIGIAILTTSALFIAYALGTPSVFGSLPVFAERWQSNPALFAALSVSLPDHTARIAAATLVLAIALVSARRTPLTDAAFIASAAAIAFSPVIHPWYLTWLVALLPLTDQVPRWATFAIAAWTYSVFAAYAVLPRFMTTGEWSIPVWAIVVQFAAVLTTASLILTKTARWPAR